MSVIRRPGVLGRTTQRRLVGMTAALSAALVETLAVGTWFVLVVETRTLPAAMAGLAILVSGSLLRVSVFGATTADVLEVVRPRRLVAVFTLTGCWLVWLLVAERVGGPSGVAAASVVLATALTGQFALERQVFRVEQSGGTVSHAAFATLRSLLPGALVAAGATALLSTAWYVDWTVTATTLSLEGTALVLELGAVHAGLLAFGCVSFLAQQRRFHRLLA